MKKVQHKHHEEMLPEYDFSQGIRGKHYKKYSEGSNIVVLEPDVAKVFHDSKSVNRALRAISTIIKDQSQKVSA